MNMCMSCSICIASAETWAIGYPIVPANANRGKTKIRKAAPAPVITSLTEYHTAIPATRPISVAGSEKKSRYLLKGIPNLRRAISHVVALSSMTPPPLVVDPRPSLQ